MQTGDIDFRNSLDCIPAHLLIREGVSPSRRSGVEQWPGI